MSRQVLGPLVTGCSVMCESVVCMCTLRTHNIHPGIDFFFLSRHLLASGQHTGGDTTKICKSPHSINQQAVDLFQTAPLFGPAVSKEKHKQIRRTLTDRLRPCTCVPACLACVFFFYIQLFIYFLIEGPSRRDGKCLAGDLCSCRGIFIYLYIYFLISTDKYGIYVTYRGSSGGGTQYFKCFRWALGNDAGAESLCERGGWGGGLVCRFSNSSFLNMNHRGFCSASSIKIKVHYISEELRSLVLSD